MFPVERDASRVRSPSTVRRRIVPAALLFASLAPACDTMVPPGRAPVAVASETAIIVWDAATRTEHFIRTATFTGTDGSMAFLVPTPALPG